ncbi:chromodomain-helicase-DNA-binding protein 1-like isoform X3, partial [Leptotrombidium deliense]
MKILSEKDSKHSSVKDSDDLSDFTNDNSVDNDSLNKKKGKLNRDLKEMIANFPDIYGVRRSARCRKEPERYTAEAESDASDEKRSRHKSRKDSDDWEGSDGSRSDISDEADDSETHHKHKRSLKSSKSSKNKSKSRQRVRVASSSDDSHSDDDEDDHRGSRRNTKKVSYKEQSDHTDTDDLMEVDYTDYNAEADTGECIEKVLEQRIGKKGATGESTTPFNVEFNGDPNDGVADETETQYLIKWKGWSHLHNTWESEESLVNLNAKGLKKIENYLKREEEIKQWKDSATPEDIEYFDCQEEMAYQLRLQHMNVDRIIAHQPSKSTETCHPEYLCKFQGLPYSECTWEEGSIINKKFLKKTEEYYSREKSQRIPTKHC